jgi:hypothetical protein
MDAPSQAVGDADESAIAEADLIDINSDEGAPPVASIDEGGAEAAFSEEVSATESAFNNFDALLDHVAEVAGELGWDKFVEPDENKADDDEDVEYAERARSFQLYEMEQIPSGTADDFESGDLPRDRLFGFRGFKRPLKTLVNGVVLPSMTRIGRLEEE